MGGLRPDFVIKFPHCECVSGISRSAFKDKYSRWCKKEHYRYTEAKADGLYDYAGTIIATLPNSECIRTMIEQSANRLNCACETISAIRKCMTETAEQLPEYDTVIGMYA